MIQKLIFTYYIQIMKSLKRNRSPNSYNGLFIAYWGGFADGKGPLNSSTGSV
jgi:hypothetical protein